MVDNVLENICYSANLKAHSPIKAAVGFNNDSIIIYDSTLHDDLFGYCILEEIEDFETLTVLQRLMLESHILQKIAKIDQKALITFKQK